MSPIRVALFSGGHDSLTMTHYAMSNGLADEVAHVDTGIGVDETREFVRRTCRDHDWPLIELHPPFSYEQLMFERGWTRSHHGGRLLGFPGPGMHTVVYRMLKERALQAFARQRKPRRGHPFIFVTGVRQEESVRRMGHVKWWQPEPKLGWSWHAPILDWTKADCNAYIAEHGLERNLVVDALHMSGECLCGAFAKRTVEREQLRFWYPAVEARIAELELRAEVAGLSACVWGKRPPAVHPHQLRFESPGMLCASC